MTAMSKTLQLILRCKGNIDHRPATEKQQKIHFDLNHGVLSS